MTMTRKTLFLNFSIAFAFVGSVAASERHRGADAAVAKDGPAPAAIQKPEAKMVAPGVGVAKVGGNDFKFYADGHVGLDEITASFGSMERLQYERSRMRMVSMAKPSTGEKMYADGSVSSYDAGQPAAAVTGAMAPTTTVEGLKQSTPWFEQDFGGNTVTIFANGAVMAGSSLTQRIPASVAHRNEIPSVVDAKGERRFADGSVYASETTKVAD